MRDIILVGDNVTKVIKRQKLKKNLNVISLKDTFILSKMTFN